MESNGHAMTPRQVLAVHDYRELMHSLGVAESTTTFACPKCSARSFVVLQEYPMEVECLRCGTVAPFSVAVGHLDRPRSTADAREPAPSYSLHVGTQWHR